MAPGSAQRSDRSHDDDASLMRRHAPPRAAGWTPHAPPRRPAPARPGRVRRACSWPSSSFPLLVGLVGAAAGSRRRSVRRDRPPEGARRPGQGPARGGRQAPRPAGRPGRRRSPPRTARSRGSTPTSTQTKARITEHRRAGRRRSRRPTTDLVAQVALLDRQVVAIEEEQAEKAGSCGTAGTSWRRASARRTGPTGRRSSRRSSRPGPFTDLVEDVGSYLDLGDQDRALADRIEARRADPRRPARAARRDAHGPRPSSARRRWPRRRSSTPG